MQQHLMSVNGGNGMEWMLLTFSFHFFYLIISIVLNICIPLCQRGKQLCIGQLLLLLLLQVFSLLFIYAMKTIYREVVVVSILISTQIWKDKYTHICIYEYIEINGGREGGREGGLEVTVTLQLVLDFDMSSHSWGNSDRQRRWGKWWQRRRKELQMTSEANLVGPGLPRLGNGNRNI